MTIEHVELTGGPDKPQLQWALAYPNSELVHFQTSSDGIDAEVRRMDELSDSFSFEIHGVVRSGSNSGRPFRAIYSVERRSGTLTLEEQDSSRLL